MSTLADLTKNIQGSAAIDEVEDVLAVLLMQDPGKLDAEGRGLVERFAARSKADLRSAAGEAQVGAYLAQHPLDGGVLTRLKAVAAALQQRGAPTSSSVAAAMALLGHAPATSTPLGGGVRPKGTIAAGPMARFNVDPKKKP